MFSFDTRHTYIPNFYARPAYKLQFCYSFDKRFSYFLHLQVTGGSSGIGKCIAIECYRQGAFITLVARNEVRTNHIQPIFPFYQVNMFAVKHGEANVNVIRQMYPTPAKIAVFYLFILCFILFLSYIFLTCMYLYNVLHAIYIYGLHRRNYFRQRRK